MFNPFTTLPKLIKSKKWIDLEEKEFKELKMNPKNWRTTVSGILLGCCMLAGIWVPKEYQDKVQNTENALMVIGLITAADAANVKRQ